ncbi:hypothetical protein [Rhizobium tubonense]|uniref:Uncharacterized protein n=1 Tax=Rhizobium tubonense TaxID=484088 RepID=A0A2W4DKX6_9HYPH|nr:hypothetical protein [Rhizobium tubonense]PZM16784.1 hypothetical protein CPY51_00575 [Rhizobium tubonense]
MTSELDQAMTQFVQTAAMHVLEFDADAREECLSGLHESWVDIGKQSGMDDAAAHEHADMLVDFTRDMVSAIELSGGAVGGSA